MHDPHTVAFQIGKHGRFCTIWHHDPEADGTDDSCGWFMRARHGSKETLAEIVRAFAFEWGQDPTSERDTTWFNMNGSVRLSRMGVVLDMFTHAAYWHFKRNRRRSQAWVRRNLADILHFAENNVDSLGDNFKYYVKYPNDYTREERIEQCAGVVYAYILRSERPWYRHPRWHIHHWHIQLPWLQNIKRYLFSRCAGCGKRFPYGYAPTSAVWHSGGPRWFKSEEHVYHHECDYAARHGVDASAKHSK